MCVCVCERERERRSHMLQYYRYVGVLVGFVGTSSTAALTAAFSVAEKPPPKDMLK